MHSQPANKQVSAHLHPSRAVVQNRRRVGLLHAGALTQCWTPNGLGGIYPSLIPLAGWRQDVWMGSACWPACSLRDSGRPG